MDRQCWFRANTSDLIQLYLWLHDIADSTEDPCRPDQSPFGHDAWRTAGSGVHALRNTFHLHSAGLAARGSADVNQSIVEMLGSAHAVKSMDRITSAFLHLDPTRRDVSAAET